MYNFFLCDVETIHEEIGDEIEEIDKKLRFKYDQELFDIREDIFLLREYVETHMMG